MMRAYTRGLQALSPAAPARPPATVIGGAISDRIVGEVAPLVAGAAVRELLGRPKLLTAAALAGLGYGGYRLWHDVPSVRTAISRATEVIGRLMR
jgi:hypothetical protein